MAEAGADEKWVSPNSVQNEVLEDLVEEEEALSLCDMPINEGSQPRKEELPRPMDKTQEDFIFSSWGGSVLPRSEMCAAEEVFFQGQILPFRRHSVSSERGLTGLQKDIQSPDLQLTRSESMDYRHSSGFKSATSRSSSISSHHSSSSGSSTTTTTTKGTRYKPRQRNQFHSHPSPTPQLRYSRIPQGNVGPGSRKSTVWSLFKVGLVRTPENSAAVRTNTNASNKSFGSRNSTSSSSSSLSNGKNNHKDAINVEKKKKKPVRFFDASALFGGCKCSAANAVDYVVIKRSISVNEDRTKEDEVTDEAITKNRTKQAMSRHRTFEWLKQLSLEGGGTAPDVA
ncbi:hypothetical protein RJ639_003669 [Escallonia herrerae]|uniref:Uncharacterized protein n=1 Tax=Escallonia herrerae TaxID=1293975 RepID=A0AA88W0W5_9ASTE|nr:hypothetical protein RJ639_003669 [Escallonia herrerae]